MKIWHHALRPESLTYTIAKALSYGDHEITVSVARSRPNGLPTNEIERRVYEIPRVTIVSRQEVEIPHVIDRLIVQVFPRPADTLHGIRGLADRARRITLISAGDRSHSLRDAIKTQWLETRRLALNLRKVDRILYKDGYHPRDLLGWLASRSVVGFDAHSQYLQCADLFGAIHARDWRPESVRPIRVNFIGSRDPKTRTRILDDIRHLFKPTVAPPRSTVSEKTMLWREYSDAVPDALSPEAFVQILAECDFTLCPRGYSLITHRPIEALLRGSIPILATGELDLYGFALEDGKNCIAVPDGRWAEAIERISAIGEQEMIEMRRNVEAMFERDLVYRVLAARIRSRLGVDEIDA